VFSKLGLVSVVAASFFISSCAPSATTEVLPPTVKISNPLDGGSSVEVFAKKIPVSASHSMLVPLDWHESLLNSPLGFNVMSYSDFGKWQKMGGESSNDLILPLSNVTRLNFIRMPAEMPNGEYTICPAPAGDDFFPVNLGSSDPRTSARSGNCLFAAIDIDRHPDFKGVSSAAKLVEKVVELEENLYKRRFAPNYTINLDLERSRDGSYAVFLVKYSNNPSFNYGGVIFAEKDVDGVTTSYNAVFISTAAATLNSIEDLRSLPEFSILQTLKEETLEEN
jgi:hypothetical protein